MNGGGEYVPVEQVPLAEIVAGDPRAARAVLDLLRSMATDFEAEQHDDGGEGGGVVVHVAFPTCHPPSVVGLAEPLPAGAVPRDTCAADHG